MKYFRFFTASLLIIAMPSSFSQSMRINYCQRNSPEQKDWPCGQCETELVGDFNQLLSDLENPSKISDSKRKKEIEGIKSVDAFLAALPEALRSEFVVMGDSRSVQRGNYHQPRTILKSRNSEVVLSFSEEGVENGNGVEILTWNGEEAQFKTTEVKFNNYGGVERPPRVTREPESCIQCHGAAPELRPIFDPYNFWTGQIPFGRDTLVSGTKDAEKYLGILKKIEDDEPRYRHLKPSFKYNDPDEIKKNLEDGRNYSIESVAGGDGPGVAMFDEMYFINHCRIANLISDPKHNPEIETLQYVLAAIMKGCKNYESYLPPEVNEQIQAYFKKRGMGDGSIDDVTNDTKARQEPYFQDRVGRQLWILERQYLAEEVLNNPERLEEFYGNDYQLKNLRKNLKSSDDENVEQRLRSQIEKRKEYVRGEIEKGSILFESTREEEEEAYKKATDELNKIASAVDITDKERNLRFTGPLRYILESSGVDMSTFSISVDPLTYTFADFFGNLRNFGVFAEHSGKSCEDLKNKSLEAFKNNSSLINLLDRRSASCRAVDTTVIEAGKTAEMEDIRRQTLREGVKDIFRENSCSGCHDGMFPGAPLLPFGNMNELDKIFAKQAGEAGDLATMIWNRVKRHEGTHGVMPAMGGELSDEDKAVLKEYLQSFKSRDYIDSPISLSNVDGAGSGGNLGGFAVISGKDDFASEAAFELFQEASNQGVFLSTETMSVLKKAKDITGVQTPSLGEAPNVGFVPGFGYNPPMINLEEGGFKNLKLYETVKEHLDQGGVIPPHELKLLAQIPGGQTLEFMSSPGGAFVSSPAKSEFLSPDVHDIYQEGVFYQGNLSFNITNPILKVIGSGKDIKKPSFSKEDTELLDLAQISSEEWEKFTNPELAFLIKKAILGVGFNRTISKWELKLLQGVSKEFEINSIQENNFFLPLEGTLLKPSPSLPLKPKEEDFLNPKAYKAYTEIVNGTVELDYGGIPPASLEMLMAIPEGNEIPENIKLSQSFSSGLTKLDESAFKNSKVFELVEAYNNAAGYYKISGDLLQIAQQIEDPSSLSYLNFVAEKSQGFENTSVNKMPAGGGFVSMGETSVESSNEGFSNAGLGNSGFGNNKLFSEKQNLKFAALKKMIQSGEKFNSQVEAEVDAISDQEDN